MSAEVRRFPCGCQVLSHWSECRHFGFVQLLGRIRQAEEHALRNSQLIALAGKVTITGVVAE
jgi:hypothetical protein